MIALGHWLGLASLCLAAWLVASGYVSGAWLWASFAGHLAASAVVSVALHRYFAHGAFEVSKTLHWAMALASPLVLHGSGLVWAAAHVTHHRHSDTDRDVHYIRWDYLLFKRYRKVPMVNWRLKQLSGDAALAFSHRYALAIWLVFVGALWLVSPTALLFCYLVPLGTVHLVGAIHHVTTHATGEPRNLPWMELFLPTCGEWHHATHHQQAARADFRSRWWHLDLGYFFIRLFRQRF